MINWTVLQNQEVFYIKYDLEHKSHNYVLTIQWTITLGEPK